jgi:hypothetical protein
MRKGAIRELFRWTNERAHAMKLKTVLASAAALAILGGAPAVQANTATFEGVTINLTGGGGTLTLQLLNVASSTGTWADATFLDAIALNNIGVSSLSLAGWTSVGGGLDASGCNSSGAGWFCVDGHAAVSDNMTFNFSYTGTLVLDGIEAPHLKVQFVDNAGAKVGSLYSDAVPVPEPTTYALMLAGLGAVGFMARRRRQG